MTLVHCETSTGTMSDVAGLARVAHEFGVMTIVDSVSGIGGVEFRFDEWGVDFAITASQKAIALPPGIAFAVASPRFLAAAERVRARGLYLDVLELDAFASRMETPTTPAEPLFFALAHQLAVIREHGLSERLARHAEMRATVDEWMSRLRARGIAIDHFAPTAPHSPTVSVLQVADVADSAAIVATVRELGFVIGPGHGSLRSETLRIGHMGDHTVATLKPCLEALTVALERHGPR